MWVLVLWLKVDVSELDINSQEQIVKEELRVTPSGLSELTERSLAVVL